MAGKLKTAHVLNENKSVVGFHNWPQHVHRRTRWCIQGVAWCVCQGGGGVCLL